MPLSGWAKPGPELSGIFSFDLDALLRAGHSTSIPELVWVLRRDHGIHVLEVPDRNNSRHAFSQAAWKYFHAANFREVRGVYLGAYTPGPEVEGLQSGFFPRPFWDRDLILFRSDVPRHVILHEFMHHLINARHRESSGLSFYDWGRRTTATDRFNELLDRNEDATEAQWKEALETMLAERVASWQEEFFVNRTLLIHRAALGLDPSDVQHLVLRMQQDFEEGFDELAYLFELVREAAAERGSAGLHGATGTLKWYVREARLQAERSMKSFWAGHREFRAALELAEKQVYLTRSDIDSVRAVDILGVHTTRHLDVRSLHLIHWIRVQNLPVTDPHIQIHLDKLAGARALLIDRHKSRHCAETLRAHGS